MQGLLGRIRTLKTTNDRPFRHEVIAATATPVPDRRNARDTAD